MVSQVQVSNAGKRLEDGIESYLHTVLDGFFVPADATIGAAAAEFLRSGSEFIFIVNNSTDMHLTGIVTPNDIKRALDNRAVPTENPVMDAATKRLVYLREDASVKDAANVFSGNSPLGRPVEVIPVVAKEGLTLKGYLEAADFLSRITA